MANRNVALLGMEAGKNARQNQRTQEAWNMGESGRELAKEQNDLALDVHKAGDDLYGGRVQRAQELANQAKYIKTLDIKTKESQNAYRTAQSAKMNSAAFDSSSGLYSVGGDTKDLSNMSEASGGSKEPNADGSYQVGPSTYRPLAKGEMDITQQEEKQELQDSWDDMLASGELEEVQTANGIAYKIVETGQMFDPELTLIKDGKLIVSPLDPGVALGTANRMKKQKDTTEPVSESEIDVDSYDSAEGLLKQHGVRAIQGKRSPEYIRKVGKENVQPMHPTGMNVTWRGKTSTEKAKLLQDLKSEGFSTFGIGKDSLYVDRSEKGSMYTLNESGKIEPWAKEAINGKDLEANPMVVPETSVPLVAKSAQTKPGITSEPTNTSMWQDKPLDDNTFQEKAGKTINIINSAIEKKAATAEQKEFGVLLTTDAEWAQEHGITNVEEYAQYKDIVKEKNKDLVKSQKTDDALKKVSSYEDYINDPKLSFTDKAERLGTTSTLDIKRLDQAAKEADVYDEAALKPLKSSVNGIRNSSKAMLNVAQLYGEMTSQTEYKNVIDQVKQVIGTYASSEDPRQKAKEVLSIMAKAAKGKATATKLKEMSGTAASDQEFARTILYTFGPEGADKQTTLATIMSGLISDQKELEGHTTSAIESGGYSLGRNSSRLFNQIGKYLKDPAFKGINAALAANVVKQTTSEKPKANSAQEAAKQMSQAELKALQQRAKQAGKTMSEQAKEEGLY